MINTLMTLLSAEMLTSYVARGFWGRETIFDVVAAQANRRPGDFAMRDQTRRMTYRMLADAAEALASDLAANGVRVGQRVAVWLPSRVETAIALLACSRNGYVCCPSLHRDHTVVEVADLIKRMGATAVIMQPGYGADAGRRDLAALLEAVPSVRTIYSLSPTASGEALFGDRFANGSVESDAPNADPNRIVYLPFTSGTTGQPKGVMHSDNTLLASARMLARDWKFSPATKVYTLSPLSHNLGLGAMLSAFCAGGELIVHDLPRGSSLFDRIVETQASFLFGVPTHAIDLLSELKARDARTLGAVTGFRISGAAAPSEVLSALMRYGITPQSGYGMTETCSHQYTLPDDDPRLIAESCGRACDGYEVRIWRQDAPDEEAPVGEVGQIGGRGASLMLGYFGDQKSTEESFNASGWFLTGDLGWADAQGFLRITGRKKDVIIRGGHNIFPARIEALAMQNGAISKAVALPVADGRLGERVCLALVLHDGAELTDAALFAHLDAAGLSRYDMPEFLLTLDSVPLTASGKVLKRALSDRITAGTLMPRPVRYGATAMASS